VSRATPRAARALVTAEIELTRLVASRIRMEQARGARLPPYPHSATPPTPVVVEDAVEAGATRQRRGEGRDIADLGRPGHVRKAAAEVDAVRAVQEAARAGRASPHQGRRRRAI
jgi:hypothetical protein